MIRKELEIEFKGESYKAVIDMAVIDRLEDSVNLIRIAEQVGRQDIRFSKVAQIMAIILQSAGCKCSVDEVYQELFSSETTQQQVGYLLGDILSCIFPDVGAKQAKKTPSRSTATRGRKSTKR